MEKFTIQAKDGRFTFGSDFQKQKFLQYSQENPTQWYTLTPQKRESKKMRGYLEGGIVPSYCKWQYDIDPRDRSSQTAETRRWLFKRDFNGEILKSRDGTPLSVPQSTKGVLFDVTQKYVDYATEHGAPIPNPELFKMWRDEYSMELRFKTFHDFLDFLGVECDAMPSPATLKKLSTR
jgi:hypothetical protein